MRKLLATAAAEVLVWYTLPLAFLAVYVLGFHNPPAAIVDHLHAITLIAASVFLLKTCVYRFIRNRPLALAICAMLYAAPLLALATYYSLVFVGLRSWGRVITQALIANYALQARQLCEAVGVSFPLAVVALSVACLLTVGLLYIASQKFLAAPQLAVAGVSTTLISVLLLGSLALAGSQLRYYFIDADTSTKEPFRLTLYPAKPKRPGLGSELAVQFNGRLDATEMAARERYQPSPNALRKNVIMIVVDALRPDHMGVYGYARDTTPYLSALARAGQLTTLDNVRASCSESACGLSSLAASRSVHLLPNNPFTLQQVLQRHGYQVHMILGGDHTNFYNLKEIYGKVDSYFDGSTARGYYMNDDTLVVDKAKALGRWDGTPTMFQFHLMSAHTLGKRLSRFLKFQPMKSYAGKAEGLPKTEFTNYYDNGVLQADDTIRELLDTLKAKGYLKSALVVITADHGESLGEHNLFAHANSVREELLQVPLLVIDAGTDKPPELNRRSFSLQIDIAPTVLHDLRMPAPDSWGGRPLQLGAQSAEPPTFTFFQLKPYVGLYDQRQPDRLWKYWVDTNTSEEFAFDIGQDPREQQNLIWQVPLPLRHEWRKTAYSTLVD
jgi:glucan phosphoethanolaminetransferase (alkaline phosphatase superfamily)